MRQNSSNYLPVGNIFQIIAFLATFQLFALFATFFQLFALLATFFQLFALLAQKTIDYLERVYGVPLIIRSHHYPQRWSAH